MAISISTIMNRSTKRKFSTASQQPLLSKYFKASSQDSTSITYVKEEIDIESSNSNGSANVIDCTQDDDVAVKLESRRGDTITRCPSDRLLPTIFEANSKRHEQFISAFSIPTLSIPKLEIIDVEEDENTDGNNKYDADNDDISMLEEQDAEENGYNDDDDDEGSLKTPSQSKDAVSKTIKYTPLELQVVQLKHKHPELILFVEVGYRWRFFGEDAQVAARHLDIVCYRSHNFLTASIPVHRLYVHLRRLVELGYKVGVIRQTETQASKTLESKKGQPFERKLVETYSRGTLIPNSTEKNEEIVGSNNGRIIMSYFERTRQNLKHSTVAGQEEKFHQVESNIVAIDTDSGNVLWDSFITSGQDRYQLLTRLIQLKPVELLLPEKNSTLLSRLSRHAILNWTNNCDEKVCMEHIGEKRFSFTYEWAKRYLTNCLDESSKSYPVLDFLFNLPMDICICSALLVSYLKEYSLESAMFVPELYHRMAVEDTCLVDAASLINLEILETSQHTFRGSLLWLLSHTRTQIGAQRLRSWLLHPLRNISAITERLDAVEECRHKQDTWLEVWDILLSSLPNLQRGISRIQLLLCKPKEFLQLLSSFQKILSNWPTHELNLEVIKSTLLRKLFLSVDATEGLKSLETTKSLLNDDAMLRDDWANLYSDPQLFPLLEQQKQAIVGVEKDMEVLLISIRQKLGPAYRNLEFKSVLNTDYLIEVKTSDLSLVAKNWQKVNATKTMVRYHVPEVIHTMHRLNLAKEKLQMTSIEIWKSFLQQFSHLLPLYRKILDVIANIDVLFSFAHVANFPNFVRPTFSTNRVLELVDMRHPSVEVLHSNAFVSNSISLSEEGTRAVLITGANMSGKSSLLRTVALCTILAQCGSFVSATAATLSPMSSILTRMGAGDDILAGKSTFLSEMLECSTILSTADENALVICDEVGRGTATMDGIAIAMSILQELLVTIRCLTLFTTHYQPLALFPDIFGSVIQNYYMSFAIMDNEGNESNNMALEDQPSESDDSMPQNIVFLYKLVPGHSRRSYGLHVAKMANLPLTIIETAQKKAFEMQRQNPSSFFTDQLLQRLRLQSSHLHDGMHMST